LNMIWDWNRIKFIFYLICKDNWFSTSFFHWSIRRFWFDWFDWLFALRNDLFMHHDSSSAKIYANTIRINALWFDLIFDFFFLIDSRQLQKSFCRWSTENSITTRFESFVSFQNSKNNKNQYYVKIDN
jgi:hypothetical protein